MAGPEPTAGLTCFRPMRIREDNRNIFLLTAVALCCAVVAGAFAVLAPVFGQSPEMQIADDREIDSPPPTQASPATVRVIGAPFVPNVNPSQR